MSKKVLLFLFLVSTCQAIQPALVKDPFNTWSTLYGWVPADEDGDYWCRIDFTPMDAADDGEADVVSAANSVCIDKILYGKPNKGKIFRAYNKLHCDESGTWSNATQYGWYWRASATQNDYLDFAVPSGYNRIHVLSYDVSNGAQLAFTWDDGTVVDLDTLFYDSGSGYTGVYEVIVATVADHDGSKKLRVKHNDSSGTARIIGVRCWDTDAYGDPTEARDANNNTWLGTDFIDQYNSYAYEREAVSGVTFPLILPNDSTIDWAMKWEITSDGTNMWSGGQNHWNTGNRGSFLHHSGSTYSTNGPDIFLEGVDGGGKLDASMNTMWLGENIRIIHDGYLDANSNETEQSEEPDVIWEYGLSPTGLSIKVLIYWNTECEVLDGAIYCPMWDPNDIDTTHDRVMYMLDPNQYAPSTDLHKFGAQHAYWYDYSNELLVGLTSSSPVRDAQWLSSNEKLYLQYQSGSMDGGAAVSAGDIWTLDGNWSFERLKKESFDAGTRNRYSPDFYRRF